MASIITLDCLKKQVAGGRRQRAGQVARAEALLARHPGAVIVECADERTGCRFAQVPGRAGQCEKVGGCRHPYWYQVWVSWAPLDTGTGR